MLKIREKYSNKIEQRLGNYLMKELSDVINNLSIQYNEKSKLRSPWDVWLSPSPVWASCGRVSGEWKKAMVGFSLSAPRVSALTPP